MLSWLWFPVMVVVFLVYMLYDKRKPSSIRSARPDTIRILLIEDDQDIADAIKDSLEGLMSTKFVVEHRTPLRAGLKRLHEGNSIDIILLDLNLKHPEDKREETFGVDSLRLLTLETRIPVLVISGRREDTVITATLALGASDYLIKGSFTLDVLVASIRRAVSGKHAKS